MCIFVRGRRASQRSLILEFLPQKLKKERDFFEMAYGAIPTHSIFSYLIGCCFQLVKNLAAQMFIRLVNILTLFYALISYYWPDDYIVKT